MSNIVFVKEPVPLVGPVEILRNLVPGNFERCQIVQHGGTFRLYSKSAGFTLSASDALWIIDSLRLGATSSTVLTRVIVWVEQVAHYERQNSGVDVTFKEIRCGVDAWDKFNDEEDAKEICGE